MKYITLIIIILSFSVLRAEKAIIVNNSSENRVSYGIEVLEKALNEHVNISDVKITVSVNPSQNIGKEGYSIICNASKRKGFSIEITGDDASGALYGCITLAKIIREEKRLPEKLNIADKPEMTLRGTCIGVQKPYYLPGRTVYEYPYTPETFPWFYDRNLWIEYLDMLAENRMNTLYLWNGHPFASLVRLKDYPFAVEVDDATFKKNEEIFAFLTEEAEKRGIWVIQMFYNILVSKPFAEHYGIKTQDRSRPIDPLISDYTRKSIAAFIEKYPNVGLLVCLGEAINTYEDDVEWFIGTIIPGVKDGLKALNAATEPPIVLRAHDTNCKMVMDAALPLYKNLYTMHKYNGESLTTYQPGGPWGEIHKGLSSLGSVHIENVHILANLEPFRYGSPDFIQKAVQAMHDVHGANALHLYPQASYWDWPLTADKTEPRLKEIERDWIWYEAWARYAWNCRLPRNAETDYWSEKLGALYGCSNENGRNILEAYEQSGEIAPKLLRKFGITEGNRQTLLLGMFMSQLVNPAKWRVYEGFHSSCGPVGETILQYMEKEWKGEPHLGETPPQLISETLAHGNAAAEAIDRAAASVTANKAEFDRLKNDMYCYQAYTKYFAERVKSAMLILQYTQNKDITLLEKAIPLLENSLAHYRRLVELTKDKYLYANSMQTSQRRIPVGGDNGKNKTWTELLPQYEEELALFRKNVAFLKHTDNAENVKNEELNPIDIPIICLNSEDGNLLQTGNKVFSDINNSLVYGEFTDILRKMKPLRQSLSDASRNGTEIEFDADRDVNLLVGYFNSERPEFAKAPTLETNAAANEYGQADVKIANAIEIPSRGTVNIHSYSFAKGKHRLNLGKGALIILGFIDAKQKIMPFNAAVGAKDASNEVDWLFY